MLTVFALLVLFIVVWTAICFPGFSLMKATSEDYFFYAMITVVGGGVVVGLSLIVALIIGDNLPTRWANPHSEEVTAAQIYDCTTGVIQPLGGQLDNNCLGFTWQSGGQSIHQEIGLADNASFTSAENSKATVQVENKQFKHEWYKLLGLETGDVTGVHKYTFTMPNHTFDDGQYFSS